MSRWNEDRGLIRHVPLDHHLLARCLVEKRDPRTALARVSDVLDCAAERSGLTGPSSRRAIREMLVEMANGGAIHLRRDSVFGDFTHAEVHESSLRDYLRDLVASEE